MGLFNFKRKPDNDTLFNNKVQQAKNKLEKIKDSSNDFQAKFAISNAMMMLDSISDRFTSYNESQINDIFSFIDSVLSEVGAATVGNVSFDGNTIKTVSLKNAITQYVSLISYFISNYVINGNAKGSLDAPKNLLKAVQGRMVNEKLSMEMEKRNADCTAKEAERDEITEKMDSILALVRSGTCNQSKIDALEREYNMLDQKKKSCERAIKSLNEAITALSNQIEENEKFKDMLDSFDLYEELGRSRTYSNVEEFATAAEKLMVLKERKSAESEAINDIYESTQTTKKATTSSAFAAAKQEGQANKVKLEHQAEDDKNFAIPTTNKNVDNF
jgi:hypothetical protein